MDANTPIRFEIFAGHQIVRTEILTGSTLKVGKLGSHQLRLDDASVSRLHAEIEVRNPNEVILKDMGSDQGTFVNQEPVMRTKLFSGDRVQFGDIECVITIAGQTARRAGQGSASTEQAPAQQRVQHVPNLNAEVDRGFGKVLQILALYDTAVIAYDHFHESEPGVFTLGFGVEADCVVNQNVLPTPGPFPLAEVDSNGSMLIHIPDNIDGEVMLDGKIFEIDGLRQAGRMSRGRVSNSSTLALPMRARCRLTIGEFSFLVSVMPHPGYVRSLPWNERIDKQFLASTGGVALLMGLLSIIFSMIPQSPNDLSLQIQAAQDRYVELLLDVEEEIEEEKSGSEGAEKAKDEEGSKGRKDVTEENMKAQVKGIETGDPEVIRARKQAMADAAVSDITSVIDSGLLDGDSSAVAMGVLTGFQGNQNGPIAGAAFGVGGLGGVGMGEGGGGIGMNTHGGGGLSTVGGGGGGGKGYGSRAGKTGRRKARKPKVRMLSPKVDAGNLPKAVIRRVIMSRAGGYQNCYERQLQLKRDLNGKIEMLIKISGQGRVILSKISGSTMNNPTVERCISGHIKKLKFPAPKNGKMVIVRYPFRFQAG